LKADILVAGSFNPVQDGIQVDRMPLTAESAAAVFTSQAERLGLRTAVHGILEDQGEGHPADQHSGQFTDASLGRALHLHIPAYFKQPYFKESLPEVFERARSMHMTLSMSLHWDGRGSLKAPELLPMLSVFLPTEQEVLALTGAANVDLAVGQFSGIPIIAVKLEDGGALLRAGAKTMQFTAPQINTGSHDARAAGPEKEARSRVSFAEDSFDAGVLYGYLKGWPLQRTLELAAACRFLTQWSPQVGRLPDMQAALQYIHPGSRIDNPE
jgi:sugar/nucleoside kinase (ribokinase family)